MRMVRVRAAGVCAAVVMATTGGAVIAPGVAQADVLGVCGSLLGVGLSTTSKLEKIKSVIPRMAGRGAGFVSEVVGAGCLAKELNDAAREYTLTPEAQAEYARIHARYGGYGFEDYMRELQCTPVTRGPSNADDVNDQGRTGWDCSRSPYAPGD